MKTKAMGEERHGLLAFLDPHKTAKEQITGVLHWTGLNITKTKCCLNIAKTKCHSLYY